MKGIIPSDSQLPLTRVPLAIIDSKFDDSLRLFSLSGDVSKAGVYELNVGTKLGDIAKVAGAKDPKMVYFGAAGGCVKYDPKLVVDAKTIGEKGAMLGSCTMIFVGKKRTALDLSVNLSQFFKHESCGKCSTT